MHRNSLAVLCRIDSSFRSIHNAGAFQSGNFNHLAAKFTGKLLRINLISVLLHNIHHVDGNNNRYTKLS